MTHEQDDRPDLYTFGEAFLFGAIAPGLSLFALTAAPLRGFGDLLVAVWLVALALATAGLGLSRAITTASLLGGGLLGLATGWIVGSSLFGLDFVVLILAFIGAIPIVVGTWIAYELRQHGAANHASVGRWRLVFVVLFLAVVGLVLLAVR
ncbi:hypothetical protein C483_06420 [Natrialba hulunbeirensis JCM 10989]|uniref:Uncharacterized protein n=1 Tax=Natrialba hulunbeirensis JCM 10989 TaxID=1227493 RepID=M0A2W9_9EURY|nr:hypothetical protein [Natrialba hulunbeirensis]ELY92944.1 hypothetical protein C483_06420 [Natrialba hulunbeirensis JCM 10989]